MTLLRDGQVVEGAPRPRLDSDAPLPGQPGEVTIPHARFATLTDAEAARIDAVSLAVDDDAAALSEQTLARLNLIEIDFPVYTDGRGYSHARTLRRRGYTGEIRATGDVRLDQLLFMQRVGIDGADLPDTVDPASVQRTLAPILARFDHAYQPSYPLPRAGR